MAFASALAIVAGWLLIFVKALQVYFRSEHPRPLDESLDVSVVALMPARNESEIIEQSVAALLRQQGLQQLIVIDDESTDGTQAIVSGFEDQRLTMLSAPPRGDACGKPAALAAAMASAEPSRWLVFVDADVVLEPGAVSSLVEMGERRGLDALSAIPHQELGSVVEKIVMPGVGALILAAHPAVRVEDPDDSLVFANGQLLVIRREAYEAVGGHDAVRNEVLEDSALARLIAEAGYTVSWVDGRRLARTRMYRDAAELIEGWSKNLWLLLGRRSLVWLPLTLLIGSAGYIALAISGWPWGVVALVMVVAMQGVMRYLGRAAPFWAWTAPLGAIATTALVIRSWWLHRRRAVRWKGRSYPGSGRESGRPADRH